MGAGSCAAGPKRGVKPTGRVVCVRWLSVGRGAALRLANAGA